MGPGAEFGLRDVAKVDVAGPVTPGVLGPLCLHGALDDRGDQGGALVAYPEGQVAGEGHAVSGKGARVNLRQGKPGGAVPVPGRQHNPAVHPTDDLAHQLRVRGRVLAPLWAAPFSDGHREHPPVTPALI